jgi:hypothetical protein
VLVFLVISLNPGKAPSRQLLFSFLIPLKGQDSLAGNSRDLSLFRPSADIATVDLDLRIVGLVRSHIKATASEVGPSFHYLVA